MEIICKPMGDYQTNCYIITIDNKNIIIDPGVGATDWVLENIINPIAILNTHGHFDHIWSNQDLKTKLKIPLYINKNDSFMLSENTISRDNLKESKADYLVNNDESFMIDNIKIKYIFFPGHTPGSSVIEINNSWFSGDFIFERSIGRWDFPFSNASDMIESLKKVQKIKGNYIIYPGHGNSTNLRVEQVGFANWINYVKQSQNL